MKSTIKLFLVVVLFCSTTFADGNMGGGGFTDGNMGGGGKTCTSNCLVQNPNVDTKNDTDQKQSEDSILDFVKEYLFSVFG